MKRIDHPFHKSETVIARGSESNKNTAFQAQRKLRRVGAKKGFSLVEVVMAMGMVSFALLGVVALIPVGLMGVRNAETLTATGNIVNQLRGQMQQLSFSGTSVDSIQSLPGNTYYYTAEGIPTNQAGGYYKATFAVSAFAPPAATGETTGFNPNSAQNVVVNLTYPPSAWNKTYSFSLLVARATDE